MTKVKYFMIVFVTAILLLMLPNMVNATTVTSEKIVTSTNGSVTILIKGLELEDGASYEWAIEKTKGADITSWYDVVAPEYSTGNIKVTVAVDNESQLALLKLTDSAYITVRKVGETDTILKDYNVDLSLPLLKVFTVTKSTWYDREVVDNPAYEVTSIYGINYKNVQFMWEKITDPNIVNNYIDNNHDLSGLNLKGRESFPSLGNTSWKSLHKDVFENSTTGIIKNGELPKEDGLYYLWLMASSSDVKTIYGQAVVEVGEVTKISTETKKEEEIKKPETDTKKVDVKDNTVVPGNLQYNGLEVGITFAIILTAGIVLFTYLRYNKYRDIK